MSALDLTRLIFKERPFTWFDTYDIYDARGIKAFFVKGQPALGHVLNIYDDRGLYVATVKEVILSFLPCYEIWVGEKRIGTVRREVSFLNPVYNIEFMGWRVEGDIFEWDYSIYDVRGSLIARIGKQVLNWTDTYFIDVPNPENALYVLAFTLAMDAEKCSRD